MSQAQESLRVIQYVVVVWNVNLQVVKCHSLGLDLKLESFGHCLGAQWLSVFDLASLLLRLEGHCRYLTFDPGWSEL